MMDQHTQICYEHAFTKAVNRYDPNTFLYLYPEHWLSYPSSDKAVALRSINVTPAPRRISLNGLWLRSSELSLNLAINLTLGANENMNKLNDRLQDKLMILYQQYKDEVTNAKLTDPNAKINFMPDDIALYYDDSDSTFNIVAKDTYYIQFQNPVLSQDFCELMDVPLELFTNIAAVQDSTMPKQDFNSYLKVNNIDVTIDWYSEEDLRIKAIRFNNIWNRSQLIVTSSLSTLAEDKYFTLSNVQYETPKYYTVNGYTKHFTISLYDAVMKQPVKITAKDLIVIEMILLAK